MQEWNNVKHNTNPFYNSYEHGFLQLDLPLQSFSFSSFVYMLLNALFLCDKDIGLSRLVARTLCINVNCFYDIQHQLRVGYRKMFNKNCMHFSDDNFFNKN